MYAILKLDMVPVKLIKKLETTVLRAAKLTFLIHFTLYFLACNKKSLDKKKIMKVIKSWES